jgi:hypothetical protein
MNKRIDFYETYYKNVSPTDFEVVKKDDKIEIKGFDNKYPKGFSAKDVKQYPVNNEDMDNNETFEFGGKLNMKERYFDYDVWLVRNEVYRKDIFSSNELEYKRAEYPLSTFEILSKNAIKQFINFFDENRIKPREVIDQPHMKQITYEFKDRDRDGYTLLIIEPMKINKSLITLGIGRLTNDQTFFDRWSSYTSIYNKGGMISEQQRKENELQYIDYLKKKGCYRPLSRFQGKFAVDLDNIIGFLKKIDKNFTIDTNPNNFGYTFEMGGTMCLFDIEDVQNDGGAWELIEDKYSTIEPFENPINNNNYQLLGMGEASQGGVFLDKRDGSVIKLTASPFEVLGTHKVMEAQKKDENYLYNFPAIDWIKNVGKLELEKNVHTKYPSPNNYYAIRRSDIVPFNGAEKDEVACYLEQIIEYWKIVEELKGYSGTALLQDEYDDGLDVVGNYWKNNYKKGGKVKTYRNKYNKKYGYSENESHSLKEISKDTGVSKKGLQKIYNKGIGAYKTNPQSVRPNVKSKEQWAMGRVYSAVMGGKASKIDAKELKMLKGGNISTLYLRS